MKRKKLLLSVVILFAAGIFASCGRSQENSGDPNVFTLLADSYRAPGPGWFGLYDVIERKTGVKVDLRLYPYQAALEQKNIMLSTGNYTDAIGGWILTSSDIVSLAGEQIIIPLEDLMENTKDIKEALEVPGIRTAMTLPDGHIYSPPWILGEPLVTFNPWINQTWLDQLGINIPSTPEEFKQALIAFRDRIPNVDGQRIIPFSGAPTNLNLGALAGWWGLNAYDTFAVINGRIESTIDRHEYRELIRYFADLYRERLIDPEIFTQDNSTWAAKGKLGLYGASFGYGPGDWIPEVDPRDKASDPSKNWGGWVPLPVLRAPGVSNPVYRNNNFGTTLFRNQFVITDKASGEKVANIMKWLDVTYDPVHSHEHNEGPVDVTWEILSQTDGVTIWQSIDTSSWTEDERARNGWGGHSVASLPMFQRLKPYWIEQPRPGWENAYVDRDVRDALYEPYLETTPMPALWFNADDAKKAADLGTAIAEYVTQKRAEWISGQANVDAEWDSYVAQLNRLGLQELLTLTRSLARI